MANPAATLATLAAQEARVEPAVPAGQVDAVRDPAGYAGAPPEG